MPSPSGNLCFVDFETRSRIDLPEVGAYRYAEDPSTRALCMAYAIGDAEPSLWIAGMPFPTALRRHLEDGGIFSAYNAGFERAIWHYVCSLRHGWPEVPLDQWQDTMAQVAVAGYPLSLGQAAAALGVDMQKDQGGRALMLKWCKPLPLKKSDAPGTIRWASDPAELEALHAYCMQDVRTERAVHYALPPLTPAQQAAWELTQRINDRGLPLDLEGIAAIRTGLEAAAISWGERVSKATGGAVTGAALTAPAQLRAYLAARGVELPDMTKGTVEAALAGELPDDCRAVLRARAAVGRSSTKKLDAMAACANADGRVRGTLCYHGAHTGRWAGRLVQPQNFPRDQVDNVDDCLADLDGDPDLFRCLWGDPFDAAAGMIRGMIRAPEGRVLAWADYSAIEARVLAWLAGEEWRLQVFRTHGKIYEASASAMFGIALESITKGHPARQKGKVAELALGYQGGPGAMLAMGALEMGLQEDELPGIVDAWRMASPNIVGYWKALEGAARRAVREPGLIVPAGPNNRVMFRVAGDRPSLRCRLPSGRVLYYPAPAFVLKPTKIGPREVLTYMGVHPKTHKWTRLDTYGGKLVENVVQAVSADLITGGMLEAERAGFAPIMSVHDEAVAEVAAEGVDIKAMEAALATLPAWAKGLPFKAEGDVGRRYQK